MSLQSRLVAAGLSAIQAVAIQGTVQQGLSAAGSTQANAFPLPADINYFANVTGGQGTVLPAMNPGDEVVIFNNSAAALLIYPPLGAKINKLGANAGYSNAAATPTVVVFCVDPLTYIATQSA